MDNDFDRITDALLLYHLVAYSCTIYWPWPLNGTKMATKWSHVKTLYYKTVLCF